MQAKRFTLLDQAAYCAKCLLADSKYRQQPVRKLREGAWWDSLYPGAEVFLNPSFTDDSLAQRNNTELRDQVVISDVR